MEPDFELRSFKDGAQDHELLHLAADIHRGDQVFDQRRNRTEAVAHLVANLAKVLFVLRACEPAIEHQALVLVGNVSFGNVGRDGDSELGFEVGAHRLAAQLGNRLFHHLGVELEADRRDLPVLLVAEQIAGAAVLEIGHRELEPTTAFGFDQFTERIDSPLGIAGDDVFAGDEKICVRLLARAPDAAAQLVELGEAEMIRAVDYHGVGIGNVEAGFYYRAANQHVDALFDEVAHHVLELALLHLAMRNCRRGLGHQGAKVARHVVDILDAVVHEEDLPAAVQLAQNRSADGRVVEMRDEGANHLAVRRRGLNHREIADAEHRHVQSAWNRRRGHGQHGDELLEFLDSLLVSDAKAMLLVDDQQAEARKLNVARKQAMSADDNINFAAKCLLDDGAILLVAAKPRDHLDPDRIVLEALAESIRVLLGENRGRHQQSNLATVHDGDERGAKCDFGFAEAGVAADQAVHRFDPGQVADDVVDCGLLVRRLLKLEARCKLLVVYTGGRIGVALEHLARRVHVEQFGRHRKHGVAGAALYFFPGAAAELVELRFRIVATDITLDQIYPLDGDVHRVVACVFEVQEIAFDVGDLEMPESAVLRDSMVNMHDEIVGLQLLEIEQHALCGWAPAPMDTRLAENFLFAVDVESVGLQDGAGRNFAFHDRGAIIGPFEQRGEALTSGIHLEVPGFEMAAQTRDLIAAFDDHQRSALSALDFTEFGRERLEAGRCPHAV